MKPIIEGDMPPCQHCGGPLAVTTGQHIIWSTKMTIDANGEVESVEEHSGWCGSCIADWNERMGSPAGSQGSE